MLRTRLSAAIHVALVVAIGGVSPAQARTDAAPATVSELPLPGGLEAALAAVGDEAPPDRAQFLIEFIRRTYDTPLGPKADARALALRSLIDRLAGAVERHERSDLLPLPLSQRTWLEVVFKGRERPETLAGAILQSRSASLLYSGLLALDDDTRRWLEGQPDLIARLAWRHPAAFLAAAPGLRVAGEVMRLPGGAAAEPVWEELVGQPANQPAEFIRALVSPDDTRLAYFFGAIAQLTPPQARVALGGAAPAPAARIELARRVYDIFQQIAASRTLEQRAFARAALDPALFIAELPVADNGQPTLPGTRGLWRAVFRDRAEPPARNDTDRSSEWSAPADFPSLCGQVFQGAPLEQHRRFMMVLFGSRLLARSGAAARADLVDAIRAAGSYPALTAVLERAGVADAATIAAAARRATAITAIGNEGRTARALAQFQGGLALIGRAAFNGTVSAAEAGRLVASLSAVPLSARGDYDGGVVDWLRSWLDEATRNQAASSDEPTESVVAPPVGEIGPMEARALRVLAGPLPRHPRVVDWEGTAYRVDLSAAAAIRAARALGDGDHLFLSSAAALLAAAEALEGGRMTPAALQQHATDVGRLARQIAPGGPLPAERYRAVATALQRAASARSVRAAVRRAPSLRLLADDLLARGLMELAYAAALGPRDGLSITAAEAATRHDFGFRSELGPAAPWRPPQQGTDASGRWRIGGALLGLDVALADFLLVRQSARPPARRPSLTEADRRVFVDAVALVAPASLTDEARDRIVAAIAAGRARVEAARDAADVAAIADRAGLSAVRRTLLAWTVAHDPAGVQPFLSPGEVLWVGLEGTPDEALHAWGAPATARLGCLCLRVPDRQPWEMFSGRWNTGLVAAAFPDLHFRLAEILAGLNMPGALLGPVLGPATLDFVTSAISRDPDDRRGLVAFVQSLRLDRVEGYLALLTTDGPLMPVEANPRPGGGIERRADPSRMAPR